MSSKNNTTPLVENSLNISDDIRHKTLERLSSDAYKVMEHVKNLSLSGDMHAARVFCDFMFNKTEANENAPPQNLELSDAQALKIMELANEKAK